MITKEYKQTLAHRLALSKAVSGKNNGNFINGNILREGRWYIWVNNKRMRLSRYIAEQCLKRKLTKDEEIHHINEDPLDDRPKNLYLFSTKGKHTAYHNLKNKPTLISNLEVKHIDSPR